VAFALAWMLDGSALVEASEPSTHMPFYAATEMRQARERRAPARGLRQLLVQ